jgi:hypothetical protein
MTSLLVFLATLAVTFGATFAYVARRNSRRPKWQTIKYRHRCTAPTSNPWKGELLICRDPQHRCTNWYYATGRQWVRLSWLDKLRRGLL